MQVHFIAPQKAPKSEADITLLTSACELLSWQLSKDYSGSMRRLMIELELTIVYTPLPPQWSFRYHEFNDPCSCHVRPCECRRQTQGHFTARLHWTAPAKSSEAERVHQLMDLLFESTAALVEAQGRLRSFDAISFRSDLHAALLDIKHQQSNSEVHAEFETQQFRHTRAHF